MTCIALITLIAAMSLWCISPSMAEVGVTDACQDDVRELEDKMKDNKDDYTAESRRKAKSHLMGAKTNRLNPAKCRKNILDAREELRKGKRDKKKKD
jgi:alpha/beta superfamily hydrolase